MLLGIMAAVGISAAELNLELACRYDYQEVQFTRGQTNTLVDGSVRTSVTTIGTPVTRTATAHVTLHGESGELVLPQGKRELMHVTADTHRISASYELTGLFGRRSRTVEINRMTGVLTIAAGSDIITTAMCSPKLKEPVEPKF